MHIKVRGILSSNNYFSKKTKISTRQFIWEKEKLWSKYVIDSLSTIEVPLVTSLGHAQNFKPHTIKILLILNFLWIFNIKVKILSKSFRFFIWAYTIVKTNGENQQWTYWVQLVYQKVSRKSSFSSQRETGRERHWVIALHEALASCNRASLLRFDFSFF